MLKTLHPFKHKTIQKCALILKHLHIQLTLIK